MAKIAKKSKAQTAKRTIKSPVKTIELIRGKDDVTATDVWNFIRKQAGGQPSNVILETLDNVDASAARPFPFTNMTKDGRRARIFWAIIQGVQVVKGEPKSHRLDHFFQFACREGMSKVQMLDILAAFNGGFSRSSKTYGTSFLKLVATQPKVS